MSKFANSTVNGISPYVPGEQPKDKKYVKLNTNENPYYTCGKAVEGITKRALESLNRYSDPESIALRRAIADYYQIDSSNVLATNGSDEALAFCFMAYGHSGICYPDITYGFYDVIANLFDCEVEHIKLDDDFKICAENYKNKQKTIVIANPNAQTGISISRENIEIILKNNKENIVIIDQAYADFGDFNAISLIDEYDNLITVNTFSKSRSLAGARVGFIIANKNLIEDVTKVKNSFHPYNVNSISAALAATAIADKSYFDYTVDMVKKGREELTQGLIKLGFSVLPSSANFVLAKSAKVGGKLLYEKLKDCGVLVRYFGDDRIKDYVRITVGTHEEIKCLLEACKQIIGD